MKGNWLKTVVAGVAIACLAIPLTAMGETKAESAQKLQQHQALTSGKVASHGKIATSDQRVQRKALRDQKFALIRERGKLVRQGNKEALDANRIQMASVNAQLKQTKGGAK